MAAWVVGGGEEFVQTMQTCNGITSITRDWNIHLRWGFQIPGVLELSDLDP